MPKHSKARPGRQNRVRTLLLEALEQRSLLCDVTAALSAAGVLEVSGGQYSDSIALVYNAAEQTIEVRGAEHALGIYPVADVSSYRIDALGGDDLITVDPQINLRAIIDGGEGTDTIVGLSGIDPVRTDSTTIDQLQCFGIECFLEPEGGGQQQSAALDSLDAGHAKDHESHLGLLSAIGDRRSGKAISELVLNPDAIAPSSAAHAAHASHAPLGQMLAEITGTDSPLHHHITLGQTMEAMGSHARSFADGSAAMNVHAVTANDGEFEHSADSHGLDAHHEAVRAASTSAEFATRSPYKGECPTSSAIEAVGMPSSSGPQTLTGEYANTQSGAPKIGCKCLAMQRDAEEAKSDGSRPVQRVEGPANLNAKPVEQTEDSATARPSCCQNRSADDPAAGTPDASSNTCSIGDDNSDEAATPIESSRDRQGAEADLEADQPESAALNEWQRAAVFSLLGVGGLTLHFQQRFRRKNRAVDTPTVRTL